MILEVETATTQDRKNKPTQYVVKMKGSDANGVEFNLIIKSDWKIDIEKYVPMRSGKRRRMDLELLDHTLSEYEEKDMAAHEQELRSEILEQEQRRRELLQEQEASS